MSKAPRHTKLVAAGLLIASLGALLPAQTAWEIRAANARYDHGLAYDSARGRTVLFGGFPSAYVGSETAEWDGTTWTRRSPATSPSPRAAHALAYDSARGRTILFGGEGTTLLSDTWEYSPVNPASHAPFGNGCQGSAGIPTLGTAPGQLAWLGDTFTLRLTSIPNNAPALALFGASRTSWPPFTLPFSLTPFGMTGCTLYVSGEANAAIPTSGNSGTLSLAVPNDAGLLGGTFYNQAFLVDPAANPAGVSASNAGEGKIGAK